MKPTDVSIREVSYSTEDFDYRSPIKFGGVALSKATILNVEMTVETRAGKTARGFGSMPLGNVWAFPSKVLTYDDTLGAMRTIAGQVNSIYRSSRLTAHPIDITHDLEPQMIEEATKIRLAEPVPKLATLVVASAFDAALHDGFGKVHGLNCYHTYGSDFLEHDLGHYLGKEFRGLRLDSYITTEPKAKMPLYHLIGALDPLTPADVKQPIGDGGPEHLAQWINRDGLTHLKIKLNGDDIGWDAERVLTIDRVTADTQKSRSVSTWYYSLDFNERCQNVQYLIEMLNRVKATSPQAFDRIQYIEQPTARDLKANPNNKMHKAAKIKPVVIDESLLDLETLLLAREMGYTGVAFKACKGQTQSLLLAAAAQEYDMFRCVQDLTCPGASLIHSAGLAAHIPGVAAIESNSRQYMPKANEPWAKRFPGVFTLTDGTMNTAILNGLGLGAV